MFAKLLCIANWPHDGMLHPEYPITFELRMEKVENSQEWLDCHSIICVQTDPEDEAEQLAAVKGQVLKRDMQRLANDLKQMINQTDTDHLTFVPITPLFEIWVNRLSDDQYRIVVWQDMTDKFNGASEIGYHGIRFTSNRARLMGFIRGLESALN